MHYGRHGTKSDASASHCVMFFCNEQQAEVSISRVPVRMMAWDEVWRGRKNGKVVKCEPDGVLSNAVRSTRGAKRSVLEVWRHAVALMEWSNYYFLFFLFLQTLISALTEPACKHKCSLPKWKAFVNSCSPESTHKICCSFIQEIKDYTVNTSGSALLLLISLHNIHICLNESC